MRFIFQIKTHQRHNLMWIPADKTFVHSPLLKPLFNFELFQFSEKATQGSLSNETGRRLHCGIPTDQRA